MRKFIVILLSVLLLGFCSDAWSMGLAGKFGFTGKGVLGRPFDDFADNGKLGGDIGYGFGVTGEYFISNQIAVGAHFDYSDFGFNWPFYRILIDQPGWESPSLKMANFGVFAKYIIPTVSNIAPYLKLNLGLYKHKIQNNSEGYSYDMKFGFGVGGGVMLKASETFIITGEAIFNNALVKDAEADIHGWKHIWLHDLQYIEIGVGITLLVGGS